MIQTNELRIGNIVLDEKTGEYYRMRVLAFNKPTHERLAPVKITDEILILCGAEASSDGEHFFIGHYGFCLVYDGQDYCVKPLINDPMVIAYCRFLHQLQNLYFVLTGKELGVKI